MNIFLKSDEVLESLRNGNEVFPASRAMWSDGYYRVKVVDNWSVADDDELQKLCLEIGYEMDKVEIWKNENPEKTSFFCLRFVHTKKRN